jgi:hypothetical protein
MIAHNDLFSPSRKQGDEEEVRENKSSTAPANEDYRLHGTILLGEEKVSFIEERKTRVVERYYLEDKMGAYTIKEIETDHVVLADEKDSHEILKLFQERKEKPSQKKQHPRSCERSASSRRRDVRQPRRSWERYSSRRAKAKSDRSQTRRSTRRRR